MLSRKNLSFCLNYFSCFFFLQQEMSASKHLRITDIYKKNRDLSCFFLEKEKIFLNVVKQKFTRRSKTPRGVFFDRQKAYIFSEYSFFFPVYSLPFSLKSPLRFSEKTAETWKLFFFYLRNPRRRRKKKPTQWRKTLFFFNLKQNTAFIEDPLAFDPLRKTNFRTYQRFRHNFFFNWLFNLRIFYLFSIIRSVWCDKTKDDFFF